MFGFEARLPLVFISPLYTLSIITFAFLSSSVRLQRVAGGARHDACWVLPVRGAQETKVARSWRGYSTPQFLLLLSSLCRSPLGNLQRALAMLDCHRIVHDGRPAASNVWDDLVIHFIFCCVAPFNSRSISCLLRLLSFPSLSQFPPSHRQLVLDFADPF